MNEAHPPQLALSPCPFCGRQPRTGFASADIPGMPDCGYHYIECCDVHIHRDFEDESVTTWNTRPQSRPEAELPELDADAITRAAKALCKHNSEMCGVNYDDNWKLYSDDFKREATLALQAAYGQQCAVTRPAEVGGDGDTQRLDFMLLHRFTVKRMVDTGGYMLLHEEYPFDGGEFETPREAIDAALLDFQSPPTPGSEVQS